MPGKKNTRFCSKCQVRHGAPTGKKCRGTLDDNRNRFVELYRDFGDVESKEKSSHKNAAAAEAELELSADSSVADFGNTELQQLEFKLQDRITRLENLVVSAMTELKEGRGGESKKKASAPDTDSSDEDLFTKSSRKREKRREPRFSQQQFALEGEGINSFQAVVLVGVRLARQLCSNNEEVGPVLQHLEFISKKALMGSYRHEAFISYDRAVRGRAELEGTEAFSKIATEEVATSFCAENLSNSFKGQGGKTQSQAKKRPVKYCRAYNESSCTFKNCVFNHVCMACNVPGHGKIDCTRLRGKAGGNK